MLSIQKRPTAEKTDQLQIGNYHNLMYTQYISKTCQNTNQLLIHHIAGEKDK